MEAPPLSRLRKKPTTATATATANTTTPSRKLKLVCSFNGAFHLNAPSNKFKYVGGETRIVSVDRNIGFSKLRSKISDLCPNLRSFSLKYQLLPAFPRDAHLLFIHSDEDVRSMIQAYDKLELCGKRARLWLFVCSDRDHDDNYNNGFGCIKGNRDLCVNANYVDSERDHAFCGGGTGRVSGFDSLRSGASLCSKVQFEDDKVAKNPMNTDHVGGLDHSLRKMVLKQKLLAKQTNRTHGISYVSCLGTGVNDESKMEFASSADVINHKYHHPLIDLAPESNDSMTTQARILGNAHLQGCENHGNLAEYPLPNLHPLNPRDGNLMNGSVPCFLGQKVQVYGNGNRSGTWNSNHMCNSDVLWMCNGTDAKPDLWNTGQGSLSNLNRENIMPWAVGCNSWCCSSRFSGSVYPLKSPSADKRVWGGYQNAIRNHKFVVNDARNQRIYPYQIRNHRNNQVEMGNDGGVKLDGRLSVGKCYHGLRPNANISKQGQSMRVHCPNCWKPGFHENVVERRLSMRNSALNKENLSCSLAREQFGQAVTQYGNSKPKEFHFAYHGAGAAVGNQSFSSCNIIESPSSCLGSMGSHQDVLTSSQYETHDVPCQSIYQNYQGIPINNEPFMFDKQKVVSTSGLSHAPAPSNGETLECNNNLADTGGGSTLSSHSKSGTYHVDGGIASSVDLLDNLSLSSLKGPEPAFLSPLASSDVANALWKPGLKPLDLMDEGQLSTSPKADESKVVASNPSPQSTCNMLKDPVHEDEIQQDPLSSLSADENDETKESIKCSKVIGGISSDLAAFYTHLATQDLQTIKNSDLEYIKELGSGTYGTVYHGKWKGSDVAIKKIKPSCFGEGLLEEDRLVADFWREAHLLGQLHHPNIVAFYGVVTDGPVNNLATVTEFMVNGSLKQVLRRKDRTIDRRKRLILAMDAAFGMEYLHAKNIVHFDLKSHNFLVNMRDPQRPVCKIGDLGLSKIKQRTLVSGGVRGTIPWMAPELLNSKNMVTEKVDVYSFGVVMWELLTSEEPYANMSSEEIIAGIIKGTLRPEIPSWCDPGWRSLMERCWSSDPDSRPAFSEIAKELRAMSSAMNIK